MQEIRIDNGKYVNKDMEYRYMAPISHFFFFTKIYWYFSYFSMKTYVVVLIGSASPMALLMSTHNICFCGKIKILQLYIDNLSYLELPRLYRFNKFSLTQPGSLNNYKYAIVINYTSKNFLTKLSTITMQMKLYPKKFNQHIFKGK